LLFHGSDSQPAKPTYFSVIRLYTAVKNLQQRGLARAVSPDQADAVALQNGEVSTVQKGMVAERELGLGQRNQGYGHLAKGTAQEKLGIWTGAREPYCRRLQCLRGAGRAIAVRKHRGRSGLRRAGQRLTAVRRRGTQVPSSRGIGPQRRGRGGGPSRPRYGRPVLREALASPRGRRQRANR